MSTPTMSQYPLATQDTAKISKDVAYNKAEKAY